MSCYLCVLNGLVLTVTSSVVISETAAASRTQSKGKGSSKKRAVIESDDSDKETFVICPLFFFNLKNLHLFNQR